MDDEVHDIEERLTESQEESRPPTVEYMLNLCREKDIPDLIFLRQHYPEVVDT
jgi:hypothetical protein